METLMTDMAWITIALVVVLALVGIGAWHFYQKKRSHALQKQFGPEYERTVTELGSRAKGESELKAREKRVERLEILPLAASDGARFSEAWQALQGRFVDNPKGVVIQAEQLDDGENIAASRTTDLNNPNQPANAAYDFKEPQPSGKSGYLTVC